MRRIATLLAILLLSACTGEPAVDVPERLPGLAEAIARSRATGTVRTATTMPAGVLPTTRITGAVDFTRERSETFIEIHRDDGVVLPYGRVVRTDGATLLGQYLGQDEPVWQESDGASEEDFASPNFDGLLVLDELECQAPTMRPDGKAKGRFRNVRPPATGGPTRTGLIVTSARLDHDGRIAEVTVIVPSMADAGEFRMVFTDYGDPVRITVPTS